MAKALSLPTKDEKEKYAAARADWEQNRPMAPLYGTLKGLIGTWRDRKDVFPLLQDMYEAAVREEDMESGYKTQMNLLGKGEQTKFGVAQATFRDIQKTLAMSLPTFPMGKDLAQFLGFEEGQVSRDRVKDRCIELIRQWFAMNGFRENALDAQQGKTSWGRLEETFKRSRSAFEAEVPLAVDLKALDLDATILGQVVEAEATIGSLVGSVGGDVDAHLKALASLEGWVRGGVVQGFPLTCFVFAVRSLLSQIKNDQTTTTRCFKRFVARLQGLSARADRSLWQDTGTEVKGAIQSIADRLAELGGVCKRAGAATFIPVGDYLNSPSFRLPAAPESTTDHLTPLLAEFGEQVCQRAQELGETANVGLPLPPLTEQEADWELWLTQFRAALETFLTAQEGVTGLIADALRRTEREHREWEAIRRLPRVVRNGINGQENIEGLLQLLAIDHPDLAEHLTLLIEDLSAGQFGSALDLWNNIRKADRASALYLLALDGQSKVRVVRLLRYSFRRGVLIEDPWWLAFTGADELAWRALLSVKTDLPTTEARGPISLESAPLIQRRRLLVDIRRRLEEAPLSRQDFSARDLVKECEQAVRHQLAEVDARLAPAKAFRPMHFRVDGELDRPIWRVDEHEDELDNSSFLILQRADAFYRKCLELVVLISRLGGQGEQGGTGEEYALLGTARTFHLSPTALERRGIGRNATSFSVHELQQLARQLLEATRGDARYQHEDLDARMHAVMGSLRLALATVGVLSALNITENYCNNMWSAFEQHIAQNRVEPDQILNDAWWLETSVFPVLNVNCAGLALPDQIKATWHRVMSAGRQPLRWRDALEAYRVSLENLITTPFSRWCSAQIRDHLVIAEKQSHEAWIQALRSDTLSPACRNPELNLRFLALLTPEDGAVSQLRELISA